MSAKFSLSSFLENRSLIAARVPATAFRGLLTRTMTLPVELTALVIHDDGTRRSAAGGQVVDLDGVDRLLLVKVETLDPSFEFIGLPDKDGLPADVSFRLRVGAGRHESDLAAIDARLLSAGQDQADRSALRNPLGPPVTEAVRAFLAERSAGELIDAPGASDALAAKVLPAAAAAAFAVGFEAPGLEQADFDSPAWREKAAVRERTRRAAAEIEVREEIERRRRDGQMAKVQHLEQIAERLKALRGQFPEASLESLLRKLELEPAAPIQDLASGLFPNLRPCRTLFAAAGGSVLLFEPPRWSRPAERIDAPAELGAVRSVRLVVLDHGRVELAVGCRMGVYMQPLAGGAARSYRFGAALGRREPRGGINSVAAAGGWLIGSHSEIGLTAWLADDPTAPGRIVRTGFGPVSAVRAVSADDKSGVVFTWGNRVLRFRAEDLAAAGSPADDGVIGLVNRTDGGAGAADVLIAGEPEITALLAVEGELFAGDASGRLRRRRAESDGAVEEIDRGPHKVYGLAEATLGGVRRVLVADNGYAVRARTADGRSEIQYRVSRSPVCFPAGASDYVFALDASQSRIYVWNSDDPAQPAAEIPVRALLQHSATDLAVQTGEKPAGAG